MEKDFAARLRVEESKNTDRLKQKQQQHDKLKVKIDELQEMNEDLTNENREVSNELTRFKIRLGEQEKIKTFEKDGFTKQESAYEDLKE
jgi:chromosome condensin MukBEF ATPase and DNA-binding subunit MukB